jgi:hypothetical protein
MDLDPGQYAKADRREVDPPLEVETATWSPGGTLVNGGIKLLIFGPSQEGK